MKPFYLLMLTAALACAGCCKDKSDNPPPQKLTVEQTDCTLGAFEERTATVSLSASADWTVSVVYDGADSEADAAWLAVTPANGAAGEQRLTLSADNNFRNAPRTARLDLACGGQTVQVAVTQSASGFDDTTDLTDFFDPQFAQDLQLFGIIPDAEQILFKDVAYITTLQINCRTSTSTSLQGIEFFKSLEILECESPLLTSLDGECEHGAEGVVLPRQFVFVAGCECEHGAGGVVLRWWYVGIAGCEWLHGAEGVVLRGQSVDIAGCERLHGADTFGLLRQFVDVAGYESEYGVE